MKINYNNYVDSKCCPSIIVIYKEQASQKPVLSLYLMNVKEILLI
jgi:hypothetical protein